MRPQYSLTLSHYRIFAILRPLFRLDEFPYRIEGLCIWPSDSELGDVECALPDNSFLF